MRTPRPSPLESNINVTPLVDVCLVLLIIFMVVTPMMVNGPVTLPETMHSPPIDESAKQLPITVKDDGTVYIDAVAVRKEQLASELQRRYDAAPQRAVAVRGDRNVRYGEVVAVLDSCRAAGYRDVGLISTHRQ